MKKQIVNTRNLVIRYGFALLFAFSLSPAFASTTPGKDEPFVSVKYIGTTNDRDQFQVDLINDNDEAYVLAIQEEDGTVLYKEKVTKKVFSKNFAWNSLDLGAGKLIFTVTGEKTKKPQVFEVNTQVRTVYDVVINKL